MPTYNNMQFLLAQCYYARHWCNHTCVLKLCSSLLSWYHGANWLSISIAHYHKGMVESGSVLLPPMYGLTKQRLYLVYHFLQCTLQAVLMPARFMSIPDLRKQLLSIISSADACHGVVPPDSLVPSACSYCSHLLV